MAANPSAADALGTSVALLVGSDVSGFAVEPDLARTRLRAAQAGSGEPFVLRARDGRRFSCEGSLLDTDTVLLRLSGGPDPEQRAHGLFERLARLQAVTDGTDGGMPADAARSLLERGIASLGASWASVHLVDGSGENLELVAQVAAPVGFVERARLMPLADAVPLTDALRHDAPVYLEAPADFETRYPRLAATFRSMLAFAKASLPLELEGRRIGVLAVAFPSLHRFDAATRASLEAFALQCAQAFDRARLSGAERAARAVAEKALARLERLHAFTGALAQAITPAQVVEVVVDMGLSAAGADAGGFWQVSADGADVRLLRSVGTGVPRAEQLGALPLAVPRRMPILDAIRTSSAIWIESSQQMEERYPEFFAQMSAQGPCDTALACLPLLAQGRCIAGLTYRFDGPYLFTEDARAFLQLFSWYAAQAFERARLYASEKSARETAVASQQRAEFLAHAGNILMSSLDYRSTLAALARAAVPRVADWCIIELARTNSATTPPVVAHADPAKVSSVLALREYHRTRGISFGIDAVMASGKSLLHREIPRSLIEQTFPDDPEYLRRCTEIGVASAMVVAIAARGRVLGTILLVSATPTRLYDDDDLAMAEELARRAGLAVDNALLYWEAREADLRKDEFLARLGHELRNPLAPIRTALDLMSLKDAAAFAHERTIIGRQVEHLVGLVDDLLDVSRITRGKIELRKAHVDIAGVIASAVEMASPALEQRAHQLVLAAGSGLTVLADPHRMSQAIANLLTNAAKFTDPRGRIELSANRESDEVVIRVKDSGIGITAEMLPRIFDPFVQGAHVRESAQGGLGLGLTIVASLVSLHGGSVTAHSGGTGQGSEFVVRLSFAAEPARVEQPEAAPSKAEKTTPRALRILVVDDNDDAASSLGDVLRMLGCTVQIAGDGPSALALLSGFAPDLALLDIGLPVMDGYELGRRLRALEGLAGTHLVAITGYGQEVDRSRALEAGFDDHIVKPVELAKLRELIARCSSR